MIKAKDYLSNKILDDIKKKNLEILCLLNKLE